METSGICQPPVHAIALARVVRLATATGGPDAELAQDFARDAVPRLASWHRWLATARNPEDTGLVQIHHGWESGMDNSPRWDAAYAAIDVDEQAELHRVDLAHVADPSERPSDREYRRYLHLVAQMRDVDYDDERTTQVVDFRMGDVFLTAVLAVAAEELAVLAADLGWRRRSPTSARLRSRAVPQSCRRSTRSPASAATGTPARGPGAPRRPPHPSQYSCAVATPRHTGDSGRPSSVRVGRSSTPAVRAASHAPPDHPGSSPGRTGGGRSGRS